MLSSAQRVLPGVLLAAAAGAASAVPTIYNLGLMPGGTYSTRAVVAGDGQTVTAFGDTNIAGPYQIRSFRWTVSGGITHILPLAEARGGAISIDGFAISGGSGLNGQGFHWNIPGGATLLNPLSGHLTCRSTGVSNSGAYICGSSVNGGVLQTSGRRAVRWTYAGVPTNLGIVTGGPGVNPGSEANGISADGTTVVGWSDWDTSSQTRRAFKWTAPAGPMLNLGVFAGGISSEAQAISSDNLAVCGYGDNAIGNGQRHAFRWKANTGMQDLGVLAGDTYSWAYGINYNGSCIVGHSLNYNTSADRAMIWTAATGMVSLMTYAQGNGANLAGWTSLNYAWGVSSDGTAVSGTGFFNGHERAFLITGLPCINGFINQNPIPTAIVLNNSGTPGGGSTARFSIDADGAAPLEYMWRVTVGDFAGMPPITITGPHVDDPITGLSFDVAHWDSPEIEISNMRVGTTRPSVKFEGGVYNPCGTATFSAPASLTLLDFCPADFNRDTATDFFDYLDFVDAFSAGLGEADFNRDLSIDFFDYLDFVDAFSAGC